MGLRNIQLGLFALPLSAGAMLLNDWDQVREYGILQGFDNVVVWLVVLLIGAGGLLVAATMKYADNIVKCFATAIAIVLDIVLSIPIFHFIPSWSFIVGAPLVIVAPAISPRPRRSRRTRRTSSCRAAARHHPWAGRTPSGRRPELSSAQISSARAMPVETGRCRTLRGRLSALAEG